MMPAASAIREHDHSKYERLCGLPAWLWTEEESRFMAQWYGQPAYWQPLVAHAFRRCNCEHTAKDVVQDVLERKIARRFAGFDPKRGSLDAYLIVSIDSRIKTVRRSADRRILRDGRWIRDPAVGPSVLAESEERASRDSRERLRAKWWDEALRRFPPRRIAVLRRLRDGKSPAEIAEELGVSVNAVHATVCRLRADGLLRDELTMLNEME